MKRKMNDEARMFFESIDINDLITLEQLLTLNPTLVNELTSAGNNALIYAISKKRYKAAQILVKFKIELNLTNSCGVSIFQQCLESGQRAFRLIRLMLEEDSLILDESYHLNFKAIEEHPKMMALILFEMKAQSDKSLEYLLDEESLGKIISSPVLHEELAMITLNYNREWENHEIELLVQTEADYPMLVATEESIASYRAIREPIVTAAIEQGYIITEVARDGNCFFRAIAVSIYGNSSDVFLTNISQSLRQEAIKYMRNNPLNFIDFFENREAFYWYMDIMEMPGQEADHIIIQALVDATGRSLVIHGNILTRINPRNIEHEFENHLLYDGRHYDGLRHEDNNIVLYTIYDPAQHRYFRMEPITTQQPIDILEEYEALLSSKWFLSSIDSMIPYPQNILSNDFEDNNILTGLMAIFTLLPHKFI